MYFTRLCLLIPFKMFSLRLLYRTTPTCRWKRKRSLLAKVTIFSPVMMRESASPRDTSSHGCIPPPMIRMNHLSLKVLLARKETAPGGLSVRLQKNRFYRRKRGYLRGAKCRKRRLRSRTSQTCLSQVPLRSHICLRFSVPWLHGFVSRIPDQMLSAKCVAV